MSDKIERSDEEWQKLLSPEQYRVLRQKDTERAFTGKYWDAHAPATYACAGCGQPLFSSEAKFDSGSGWPSFTAPIEPGCVATETDDSAGMGPSAEGGFYKRTEALCSRCGGHLGHVFPDGPPPSCERWCINSAALVAKKPG